MEDIQQYKTDLLNQIIYLALHRDELYNFIDLRGSEYIWENASTYVEYYGKLIHIMEDELPNFFDEIYLQICEADPDDELLSPSGVISCVLLDFFKQNGLYRYYRDGYKIEELGEWDLSASIRDYKLRQLIS